MYKVLGDLVGGGFVYFGECFVDGGDLIGEGFGLRGFFEFGGDIKVYDFGFVFCGYVIFGVLIVGVELVDMVVCFFFGVFFVEGDEVEEDVFVV